MMQKFTKLKEKVGNNIIIVGDLNTLLSIADRVTRQSNRKIRGLEQHCRPTGPNMGRTLLNKSRTHILLKHTWNIL